MHVCNRRHSMRTAPRGHPKSASSPLSRGEPRPPTPRPRATVPYAAPCCFPRHQSTDFYFILFSPIQGNFEAVQHCVTHHTLMKVSAHNHSTVAQHLKPAIKHRGSGFARRRRWAPGRSAAAHYNIHPGGVSRVRVSSFVSVPRASLVSFWR